MTETVKGPVGSPSVAVWLYGLNLVGGRLLVTASCFETLRAVMSQSNWRFRMGGSVLGEGSGSPGLVGEQLGIVSGRRRARWLAAVPAPHRRERV